jgi:hypothetical protein
MDQIKNSPEIAPSDISELMESVAAAGLDTSAAALSAFTPKPVKKTTTAVTTTAVVTHSAPPVLKRPVKLPDGTPLKRDKTTAAGGAAQHTGDGGVATTTAGVKRRFSKRSLDEEPVNGKNGFLCTGSSVANPGSGAFLTPGSGMGKKS